MFCSSVFPCIFNIYVISSSHTILAYVEQLAHWQSLAIIPHLHILNCISSYFYLMLHLKRKYLCSSLHRYNCLKFAAGLTGNCRRTCCIDELLPRTLGYDSAYEMKNVNKSTSSLLYLCFQVFCVTISIFFH